MTRFLHTDADLQAGLVQLILVDPRLKTIAEKAGAFSLRRREAGFPGLCAIVCGQQLSTASAAAIRARLFAAFDPFHHDALRRARADKLKRLGLSARGPPISICCFASATPTRFLRAISRSRNLRA
jgi:DNA-3-methyladenine glycosylase II